MPKYAFIANKYAKTLSFQTLTFQELIGNFQIPDTDSSSKDGRGILPGNYTEPFRKLNLITYHNLLILDVDKHEESEKLLHQVFDANSYINQFQYMVYNTFTSTNNNKRLRLIVEIAEPNPSDPPEKLITIDNYAEATRTLEHNLKIEADPFSHKRNSFVYTPRILKNQDYYFYTTINTKARAFNVRDIDPNISLNQSHPTQDFQDFLPEHNGRNHRVSDDIEESDLRSMLAAIPADCSRDDWLRVMQALHHYSHGAKWGFDLINEWSAKGGDKYEGPDAVWYTWDSIRSDDQKHPVKIGTLIYLAEQHNWRDIRDLNVHDYYAKFIEDNKETLRLQKNLKNLIAKVASHHLPEHYASSLTYQLVEALSDVEPKAKKRYNSKWIQDTIHLFMGRPRKLQSLSEQELAELTPEWLKRIVILSGANASNTFIDRFTGRKWYSQDTFNTTFHTQAQEFGMPAADLATKVFSLPNVDSVQFAPGHDPIIEVRDIKYLNTFVRNENFQFRDRSFFNIFQDETIEAISKITQALITDADERHILSNYFAHCIFNIGEKVNWFPLIIGAQGLGKTILGNLLRTSLGRYSRYTVVVNASDLFDQAWNSIYAEKLLVIIDEIVSSPNRTKAIANFNTLKRYITEYESILREKYMADRSVSISTNFVGCSNFLDALNISPTERRVFVIRYPFWTTEQVRDTVQALKPHYSVLFSGCAAAGINVNPGSILVDHHKGQLFREALLYYFNQYREHNHHQYFDVKGAAHRTQAFTDLTELGKSDNHFYLEALIASDDLAASPDYIATIPCAHFVQQRSNVISGIRRIVSEINHAATELGYEKITSHSNKSNVDISPSIWSPHLNVTSAKITFLFSESARLEFRNKIRDDPAYSFRKFVLDLLDREKFRIDRKGLTLVNTTEKPSEDMLT